MTIIKTTRLVKKGKNKQCCALSYQQQGGVGERRQQKTSFKETCDFLFLSRALSHLSDIPTSHREWPQSQFLSKGRRVSRCTKPGTSKAGSRRSLREQRDLSQGQRGCSPVWGHSLGTQPWDTAPGCSGLPPVQPGKCQFPADLLLY